MLRIDYFKFTSKNNKGLDIEYTLERGETEATVTLRDAERGLDSTLKVDNQYLKAFTIYSVIPKGVFVNT